MKAACDCGDVYCIEGHGIEGPDSHWIALRRVVFRRGHQRRLRPQAEARGTVRRIGRLGGYAGWSRPARLAGAPGNTTFGPGRPGFRL